jgi:cytochrome c oxidase assembly factor CtaG
MKKFIKEFFFRGLLCMGFGPIVYSIIMLILYLCNVETTITGLELFKGIISTSLMAFLIAGSSVIWLIEKIGIASQIVLHGIILYFCYLLTYLLNDWLQKDQTSILIFSIIFIGGYLLIWLIIYLIERKRTNNLNDSLLSNNKRQD